MDIYIFLEQLKKMHPGKKIVIISNEKSLDVINYSYLGRNIQNSSKALELLIQKNGPRRFFKRIYDNYSDKHHTILYSLYCSFVINYIKCYERRAKNKISLNHKEVYLGDDELKQLHDELDQTRNKFVAHDGEYEYEKSFCVLIEDPENNTTLLETLIMTFTVPSNEELIIYRELLKKTFDYIELRREKALKNFLEDIGL